MLREKECCIDAINCKGPDHSDVIEFVNGRILSRNAKGGKMKFSKMEKKIKEIVGKSIREIGREGDMMWLSMGETIVFINSKGEEERRGTHEIQVQCPWRVSAYDVIFFTSYDIYLPPSSEESNTEFEWNIERKNAFDERSYNWIRENEKLIIEGIEVGELGDLKICLSNGDLIELFIDMSLAEECWRYFAYDNEIDYVTTGQGAVLITGAPE